MHAPAPKAPAPAPAPAGAGAVIFQTADAMIVALGFADPDPEFTKIYQRAHLENANRDADVAWENVRRSIGVML